MSSQKRSIEVSQRVEFSCSYITPCDDIYDLNSIHYKFEATASSLKSYESTGRVISFESFTNLIKSEDGQDLAWYNYTGNSSPRFNSPGNNGNDSEIFDTELYQTQQYINILKNLLNTEKKFELYS